MNTCEKFWAKPSEGEVNFGHTWVKTQSEMRMSEVPGLIKRRLFIHVEGVGSSHQVAGEELPRKEEAICDILTLLRKFCN